MTERDNRSGPHAVGTGKVFGRVFGSRLVISQKHNDIEINLNEIKKIRLYTSVSYTYNIMLFIVGIILLAWAIGFAREKIPAMAAIGVGLAALVFAFRVRRDLYEIVITLVKGNPVTLPVKKHNRKDADDFVFYVNSELLKADKQRVSYVNLPKRKE